VQGRIRIGNQTVHTVPPLETFRYAVNSGFDAFEWFPDRKGGLGWDVRDMDDEARLFIRETALSNDISLSVHTMLPANPMDASTHETSLRDLEFARETGAKILNIHFDAGQGIEAYAGAAERFIGLAEKAGVRVSIENTPYVGPEEFNELFEIFNRHDIANVGMCLDVGHANLFESTRNDYLGFLDRLDAALPIVHVHLHENYGDSDSHLTVFTGPSCKRPEGVRGLLERLEKRGFRGSIILEQWPEPPALLDRARDRLREMLSDLSGKERKNAEA
jgi:sugar phosphate isomerase/epimerase